MNLYIWTCDREFSDGVAGNHYADDNTRTLLHKNVCAKLRLYEYMLINTHIFYCFILILPSYTSNLFLSYYGNQ